MPSDTFSKLWLIAFRILSLWCFIISSAGALVAAVSAFMPGASVAISLFAAVMAVLIALAGKKGLKIRSRDDIDREISALRDRRDRFESWINRE